MNIPTGRMLSKAGRRYAALALALAMSGCGLDDVTRPELDGPSELGLSVRLTATPDIIIANGFASSVIQASVRDQNGQPLGGREIVFTVADEDGRTADIGSFRNPPSFRDLGTSVSVITNANGIAQVVYEAPARTDATADQTVIIKARPVGNDASAALYRSVRIELRSPEPRLFPQNPSNAAPSCNFAIQAPNGFRANTSILFQSTSFDVDGTIIRYEWFFTDGNVVEDAPDINHAFREPGAYTVTHVVTDDDGRQTACASVITVQ